LAVKSSNTVFWFQVIVTNDFTVDFLIKNLAFSFTKLATHFTSE